MPRRPSPPKPTLVLFVRHGTTPTTGSVLPGRAPGLHLADQGRAQAESVAEVVGRLRKIAAVYASPLERTRETATPIAKRLGLPVRLEKGLLECDFGDWTGAKLGELAKLPEWRTVQRWPSGWRFPGGESFVELQRRMVGVTESLRARHPGETVVAVSHADPIKAVASSALGTPLDLFQRLVISPCSVTAIAYGDGGPAVMCINAGAAGVTDLLSPPAPAGRRAPRRTGGAPEGPASEGQASEGKASEGKASVGPAAVPTGPDVLATPGEQTGGNGRWPSVTGSGRRGTRS